MWKRISRWLWPNRIQLDLSSAKFIADYERPLGSIMADTDGTPFLPLKSLSEAQGFSDGYAILQGDDGGEIYIVVPARLIRCSAEALEELLKDIDEIEWGGNPRNMRSIYYERLEVGSFVAGGMGGGEVKDDPWVHERLVERGLGIRIKSVLEGTRRSLYEEQ